MEDPLVPAKKYRIFTVDEALEDEEEGTDKGSREPSPRTHMRSPEEIAHQYTRVKRMDQVLPENSFNVMILTKSKSTRSNNKYNEDPVIDRKCSKDDAMVKYETSSQEEEDIPEKETSNPNIEYKGSPRPVMEGGSLQPGFSQVAESIIMEDDNKDQDDSREYRMLDNTVKAEIDETETLPLISDPKSPVFSKQLESMPSRSNSSQSSAKDFIIDIIGIREAYVSTPQEISNCFRVRPAAAYKREDQWKIQLVKHREIAPETSFKKIEHFHHIPKKQPKVMVAQGSSPIAGFIKAINSTEKLISQRRESKGSVRRNSTPQRKLSKASSKRQNRDYNDNEEGATLEIKIPFYVQKREITPVPKKELHFAAGLKNRAPVQASALVPSPKRAHLHQEPQPVPVVLPSFFRRKSSSKPRGSIQIRNRANSPTEEMPKFKVDIRKSLEQRRGACNQLSFKVDIGELFLNSNNESRELGRRSSHQKVSILSRPRLSKLLIQDSSRKNSKRRVNTSADFDCSERIRNSLNKSYREALTDRYYFSTYNRVSRGSKEDINSRRESARQYFQEGIEQVRRESLRRSSYQKGSQSQRSRHRTPFESSILPNEQFQYEKEQFFDPREFSPAERVILSHRPGFMKAKAPIESSTKLFSNDLIEKMKLTYASRKVSKPDIQQHTNNNQYDHHQRQPTKKASLVKTVMNKLKISTEYLKDQDLISKMETLMYTKPRQPKPAPPSRTAHDPKKRVSHPEPQNTPPMKPNSMSFMQRRPTIAARGKPTATDTCTAVDRQQHAVQEFTSHINGEFGSGNRFTPS